MYSTCCKTIAELQVPGHNPGVAAGGASGSIGRFDIPPIRDASVSPKQSQLHKLVQQLYQAEAQV